MLKHYVELLYPGIIVSDTSVRPVENRDPARVNLGTAFGFRFFSREEVEIGGEILSGKPKNQSPWYYKGEVYNLEQARREMPDKRILIDSMEIHGYARVVKTKYGQCFPLSDGDVVLAVKEDTHADG